MTLSKFQNVFVQIASYEGERLLAGGVCAGELICDNLLHCAHILHPVADLVAREGRFQKRSFSNLYSVYLI